MSYLRVCHQITFLQLFRHRPTAQCQRSCPQYFCDAVLMATDDMRFCNTEVCPIIECEFLQVVLTQYRVDFHAGFWQACTVLYNSTVNIYNHESGAIVITFEVTEVLVRRVKFIARSKNWFVAGSDDFKPRVFNNVQYSITTLAFEAHLDCIQIFDGKSYHVLCIDWKWWYVDQSLGLG